MDNSHLPSLDMKTEIDPVLESAYKEAEETRILTPLIKQELKYTILHRRHQSGKGDLDLTETKPSVKKELTPEENLKKLRRKEQNRRAAQRCREKKKRISDQVIVDYLKEQQNTTDLRNEIEKLRREKEILEQIVSDHALRCKRAATPTPLSPPFDDQPSFHYDIQSAVDPRDSVTPILDPLEDIEPSMFLSDIDLPQKVQSSCVQPTCTQSFTDLLELELPDESAMHFISFNPGSPDLQQGGRRSISEYADCDGPGPF